MRHQPDHHEFGACDIAQDAEHPVLGVETRPCLGGLGCHDCPNVGVHLAYTGDPETGRPDYYLCDDCAFAEQHGYFPVDYRAEWAAAHAEPQEHGHTQHCREVSADCEEDCQCHTSFLGRP